MSLGKVKASSAPVNQHQTDSTINNSVTTNDSSSLNSGKLYEILISLMEKFNTHSSNIDNFIQNQSTVNMNTQHQCCKTPKIDDPGNSPITINDSNQMSTGQPTAYSTLENEVLDIMGQHDNETTLKAVRFNKELYVSNFPNNTTTDMFVSYLRSKNVNTGGVRIK